MQLSNVADGSALKLRLVPAFWRPAGSLPLSAPGHAVHGDTGNSRRAWLQIAPAGGRECLVPDQPGICDQRQTWVCRVGREKTTCGEGEATRNGSRCMAVTGGTIAKMTAVVPSPTVRPAQRQSGRRCETLQWQCPGRRGHPSRTPVPFGWWWCPQPAGRKRCLPNSRPGPPESSRS
jgi:hypothetical protein